MTTVRTPVTTEPALPHPGVLVRRAARWVRTAPAPTWEGSAASKAVALAYVAGSMLAWTAVGVAGSAAVGRFVDVVAGLAPMG